MQTTNSSTINISALQKPIGSGFDAASNASDVIKGIDLSGKVAIVAGCYSGIAYKKRFGHSPPNAIR